MKFNILILISILLSACTEVIEFDLNSSNPQIVIEGSVPVGGKARVAITRSINFNEKDSFPTQQNLTVTLTDNLGNSEVLNDSLPGIYKSNILIGVVGRTYSLSVKTVNKTITSECKIPNPVTFDSLIVKPQKSFGGGFGGFKPPVGTLYTVRIKFNDPANETNFYRFIEYKNGKSTGNIYIYEDRLNNGKPASISLFNLNRALVKGDKITVEMQCIDKTVFEYFNSFANMGMGPSSSTPANPYSNLNGAVLGYFSAHTVEQKSEVMK